MVEVFGSSRIALARAAMIGVTKKGRGINAAAHSRCRHWEKRQTQ